MKKAGFKSAVWFLTVLIIALVSQARAQTPQFDVISYDAEITPDLANKSVRGSVTVEFKSLTSDLKEITLNAGALEIDSVTDVSKQIRFAGAAGRIPFEKNGDLLKVRFTGRPSGLNERRKIRISYHGGPRYGVRFFPEQNQVYTIFSTSQWMPCVDSPADRATFRLTLDFAQDYSGVVANGRRTARYTSLNRKPRGGVWEQTIPVPTYLFGFAAGNFRETVETHRGAVFRYLAPPGFSEAEVKQIFRDTAEMLDFYESKAGMRYPQKTYTQVLAAGNAEQEMDGFTVMNERYGRRVLENEKAIWLGAHEFAHQWWGNMVTNRDWTHFWLNEGVTNFMTAAYYERRFGRADYLNEIERYRLSYERVRAAGKDKPLVFPDWNRPTREDRALVYDKGAYVVHLLREELGDELFWKGFKAYTRKYWGKSVTTEDFQKTMEAEGGRNLSEFFDKWVYLKKN